MIQRVKANAKAEECNGDGDTVCYPEVVGVVGVDIDLSFGGNVCRISSVCPCVELV